MKFIETNVKGVFLIESQRREDHRGSFARTYCLREFEAHGLALKVVQTNVSFNFRKGTLRGLHYQDGRSRESKLFRCTRGANYHVAVDMRRGSPTYLKYTGVVLSSENGLGFYVPPFCAHGYQALTDGSEAIYHVGDYYRPDDEGGVRYDDPAIGIQWPEIVSVISDKDSAWPLLENE